MEWFIASGVLGVLLTSIFNVYISCRQLKHQRNVEGYKASLSFLKDKFDVLKRSKRVIIGTGIIKAILGSFGE